MSHARQLYENNPGLTRAWGKKEWSIACYFDSNNRSNLPAGMKIKDSPDKIGKYCLYLNDNKAFGQLIGYKRKISEQNQYQTQLVYALRYGCTVIINQHFPDLSSNLGYYFPQGDPKKNIIRIAFRDGTLYDPESTDLRGATLKVIQSMDGSLSTDTILSIVELGDPRLIKSISSGKISKESWALAYAAEAKTNPFSDIAVFILDEAVPEMAHRLAIKHTGSPAVLRQLTAKPTDPELYLFATSAEIPGIRATIITTLFDLGCPVPPEFFSDPKYSQYASLLWVYAAKKISFREEALADLLVDKIMEARAK